MPKLSVCILTKDDADTIAGAIASAKFADEVVVVDNGSSDRTVEIATALGVRVVHISAVGFGEMRARAAEAGSHEWILSLDADERCTPEVRDEMLALLASGPAHDGYKVPRRTRMMGRWIKGSGWYPSYRGLQLFRKGRMRYTMDVTHEGYVLADGGKPGKLQHDILHFPYRNLEELVQKVNIYSTLGAQKLAPRRVSMWSAFGHGLWGFLKHFIFKAGFRDGWAGFVIALGTFEERFYRYAKRTEELNGWSSPADQALPRDPS
jgi:glycosyltransferase involved in cell wall biosynthesis